MARNNVDVTELNFKQRRFKGRLLGFIDDEETRAVINTRDAIKRVATAQSVEIHEHNTGLESGMRFVVITSDMPSDTRRQVFISEKIRVIYFKNGFKELLCEGGKKYRLKRVFA